MGTDVPSAYVPKLEQARRLGQELYARFEAQVVGDALMTAKTSPEERQSLGGQLVIPGGTSGKATKSWTVLFFDKADSPRILFRAEVVGANASGFERLSPPIAPDERTAALIRARQTALAALDHTPRAARQTVTPVVMPGEVANHDGTVVYMIAGTAKPQTGTLGQHFRATVSDDGAHVAKMVPLSVSALEFSIPADGPKKSGLELTDPVSDWPLETHVFPACSTGCA